MRNAFMDVLINRAAEDESIVLLTGDLGFGLLEPFRDAFPNRYVNVGICEQNMVSVAAGLALEGRKVFCYSIGNFPSMRCLEQTRNDVAYHGCDVNIICVGSGFAYGALGMSHHATEDLAIMRALPGIEVLCPADPFEARAVAKHCCESKTPSYIRLNKRGEKVLSPVVEDWKFGTAVARRQGDAEIALMCTGAIAGEAEKAARMLEEKGMAISLHTFPCVKPIDKEAILSAASVAKAVVTIEEHSVIGGFGSAVAEVVAGEGVATPVVRMGIGDEYSKVVGDQGYLRSLYGIDADSIAMKCESIVAS